MTEELQGPAVPAKEMARILGISVATLMRLARGGEIPFMRVGRSYRMFPAKVIACLEEKAAAPVDPWKQSPRSAAGHKAAATRRRLAAERAAKKENGS